MSDHGTILAVDDSPEALALLVRVLTQEGFTVHPADSGELALTAAAAHPPDLVLVDLRMPGIGGLEVCRRLKAAPATQAIPVVLLSAFAEAKEWAEGLELGAADFVPKPFNPAELLHRVHTQFALVEARRQRGHLQQLARANTALSEGLKTAEQERVELREVLSQSDRLRQVLLSVVEDQHQAERALRESEALFRRTFDDAPVGAAIVGPDRSFRRVNASLCRFLGYTAAELQALTFGQVTHADDVADSLEQVRRLMAGDGKPFEMEKRYRRKDGGVVWGRVSVGAIRDAAGRPYLLLPMVVDITARKEAEAERDRLLRALEAKNRELENLVYVTSHDLRSPLLNIQGFGCRLAQASEELRQATLAPEWTEAVRRSVAAIATEGIPTALGFIQVSVEKMNRLLDGLLRLSRLGRAGIQSERIDMNRLLIAVRDAMATQLASAEAQLEVAELPACAGEATLLNQLFSNLLDNAVKYRDPTRPLQVRVSGRCEGGKAIYEVADNGLGIAPEHLERIWDVFHRVAPSGAIPGEGLGLSLVRRVVERHSGEIRVESTVGEGSRFIVALPSAGANAAPVSSQW